MKDTGRKDSDKQEGEQLSVNMDNLRRQIYSKLLRFVKYLHGNIDSCGDVEVEAREIEDEVNELLTLVGHLGSVYIPDQENFTDLSEEFTDDFVFEDPRFSLEQEECD